MTTRRSLPLICKDVTNTARALLRLCEDDCVRDSMHDADFRRAVLSALTVLAPVASELE